ncbi:MAG: hypothetical protein E7666_06225 [Ruminococcaceae bacterium]|nr:hypothetical protein [Oscillospiraceae bacterium]
MKKILAAFLALVMVLGLFPYSVISLNAETGAEVAGLTLSGTSYGADEDYRLDQNLREVPHTFTAWVYIPAALHSQRHIILGNYPSLSRYTGYLNFEIQTNGRPRLVFGDGSNDSAYQTGDQTMYNYVFDSAVVPADTWTQVTIVSDDVRQEVRCYLNGVLKQTITDNFASIDPTAINHPFMLGGDFRQKDNKFNQYYYKAQLKDVSLYADVRTADEIAADYANGPDLANVDLICAYDIDADDHGKDIADISGNGYTLYYNKMWLTEAEMNAIRGDTSDRAYSFAVVPDIQYMTEWHQEALQPLYKWIVDNKEEKNIQFVMGLGDITNTDTDFETGTSAYGTAEWGTAYAAISQLNGVIPYTQIRGNHDVYASLGDIPTCLKGQGFIKYFGGDSFYAQQFKNPNGYEAGYYEGTLANTAGVEETDEVVNAWRTLEVDGDKWLIMALDWGAHDSVLAWAGDVIEAHPNHRVIITTHNYLGATGDHTDNRLMGDITADLEKKGFNNGDGIWDKLVSRYSNIELTLSGHIHASNIVIKQNEGAFGNTVTQMLIDAQELDRYWYNPDKAAVTGVGLVAMLYVSKDGKTIDTEYYSTVTGKYLNTMSQRTVDLDAKCGAPDTGWDGLSAFAPAGSGTEADPYLVTCAENLAWMAKQTAYNSSITINNPFEGKYFKQVCDIDLNGRTAQPIGCYYDTSGPKMAAFGGIYDGQGYRIFNGFIVDNGTASQNQKWGAGIFGVTYLATIKNVVADNLTVSGKARAGAIVGYAVNTVVLNCVSTDTCTVIGTGQKIGSLSDTSSVWDTEQFNVFSQNRIGGIVGHVNTSSYKYNLKYCHSSATVYANGNNAYAGGIVGSAQGSFNMYSSVFDGKIVNDFANTDYDRRLNGENVNGGIIGYIGSGGYAYGGGNRIFDGNINKGSFELLGVATTEVIYGGIVGEIKNITTGNFFVQNSYNLSNEINLNTDTYTQTKPVYVGGLIGKIINSGAATPYTANVANCASVSTGIQNGGINVDNATYTVDNLYVYNTVAQDGTQPVKHSLLYNTTAGTVDVGTKELNVILPTTATMEVSYAEERAKGRDSNTLKILGYQKALTEGDKRVRLVFAMDTKLEALHRYGFDMTLSYANAAGDTVVKHANVESYSVFTSINGKDEKGNDKDYVAGKDYTCKYFATLVVNPTIGGEPISGGATVTVTAYTVDSDGYRHAYGAETLTLVFDGDGNMTVPSADIK